MEIGTGTTITFASGFFAEVLSVTPPGPTRESIPVSHMLTTVAHTKKPVDLVDWNECEVEMAFDPSVTIPIADAEEQIVITFPDSSSSTMTFQGFMTGFTMSIPLEDKMTATATITVTGNVAQG
jgi:hypothetical protein